MYRHLTDSGETTSKRGASLPKNRARIAQPRPLMLQKTASSPQRTGATKATKAYENQVEVDFRKSNRKNAIKANSEKKEGADSFTKNSKPYRSPIPNVNK